MTYLSTNIKFLRKNKGLTQEDFAKKIGVNRAVIGSYEENRAEPKLSLIIEMARLFSVSADNLIAIDLSKEKIEEQPQDQEKIKGNQIRVLSTIVDRDNKEYVTVVPVKAAAGYLNGYADTEFIETLPKFSLPLPEISRERTYRVFQIQGDSMLPVPSGSYIICEYVENWLDLKDGKPYILISINDGIVFKRIYKKQNTVNELLLKSDNPEFETYSVDINNVLEIWKALGYISFNLHEPASMDISQLSEMFFSLKKEINDLKKQK